MRCVYCMVILLLGIYLTEIDTYVRDEYIQGYCLQKIGNNPKALQQRPLAISYMPNFSVSLIVPFPSLLKTVNIGFFDACSFFSPHFIHPLRHYHVLYAHGFMIIYMLITTDSHPQPRSFLSAPHPIACMISPPRQLMLLTYSKMNSLFYLLSYTHVFLLQYILSQYLVPSSTRLC